MSQGFRRTTHWSKLLQPGQFQEAWEYFYESYRGAVSELFRRSGVRPAELEDLVHDFFVNALSVRLLEKANPERGRFRGYLRLAAQRFLVSHWRKAGREKRRPDGGLVALDADMQVADRRVLSPTEAFDLAWARATLDRASARARSELEGRGRGRYYLAFSRRQAGASWKTIAEELGTTPGAARQWGGRAEQALARHVREEIAGTVSGEQELEDELRQLSQILAEAGTR